MKRLLVVLLGLAIIGFGTPRGIDWWNFNVNTPVSSSNQCVPFHVGPGETPTQIGQDLYTLALLRSTIAFDMYTRLANSGPKFQAGSFVLNTNMPMVQTIHALQHGKQDP